MDDRRPVIVLEQRHAGWRWARGYVENVAAAIALAVEDGRSAGRVYNVAEPIAYAEADWVRRIGGAVGWDGEVVAIPEADLPERLRQPYAFEQDYVVDTTRIRSELDYQEIIDEATALERTIEWERGNPPAVPAPDYAAEDAALTRQRKSASGW
jgi:nucleoside-diphosphate-sugar epimerase